jgi:hypothetical protein
MAKEFKRWHLEIDVNTCDIGDGQASVGDVVFVPHLGSVLGIRIARIEGLLVEIKRDGKVSYDCVVYYEYRGQWFSCHQSAVSKYLRFNEGLSVTDFGAQVGGMT